MGRNTRKLLLGAATLLSFAGYQLYQIKSLKVKVKELKYRDLPPELEDYTICHISDLHGAVFGKKNEKLAQVINALDYDVLCMTGDMVHDDLDYGDNFYELVSELNRDRKMLYIPGNHENYLKSIGEVKKLNRSVLYRRLTALGVNVLNGRSFRDEKLPIKFMGVDDDREMYEDSGFSEEKFQPGNVLELPDAGCFNIAMIHRPNYFRSVADYGYDLMLSGHTHGGIFRIRGLGGVLSPDVRLFPELDKGFFRYRDSFLSVSSGLGTSLPIPKTGNRPEVVLIVLKKGDPDEIKVDKILK